MDPINKLAVLNAGKVPDERDKLIIYARGT